MNSPATLKIQEVVDYAAADKVAEGKIRPDHLRRAGLGCDHGRNEGSGPRLATAARPRTSAAAGRLTEANMGILQKSKVFTEVAATNLATQILTSILPFRHRHRPALFSVRPAVETGGPRGAQLWQEPRQTADPRSGEGDLCRRRRLRRGQGRGVGGRGVPQGPEAIPEDRRAHSQGRADGRAAGNRKDPAGQGHRGRGRCAVLLHQRLGLRGDVRRRRRQPRAGHVRTGAQERALPGLH